MGEVDQFLDEVEAELARLTKENDDLRSKLSAAQSGAVAGARPRRRRPSWRPGARARGAAPEPEPTPTARPRRSARSPPPASRRSGSRPSREASNAAARLLEIATPQRRRARRGGQERGRQDRRRGPHQGRAPRVRVQDQGRPARGRRPHPRADARLRDRRAPPADVRRPGEGARQAQRRGREPALLRARVPLPPQELLHPAARGARGSGSADPRRHADSSRAPKRLRSILGEDEG